MSALQQVHVRLAVVLGSTHLPIGEVVKMGRGATIPLDGTGDDLSELHVNGMAVARGSIEVAGERISLRVYELLQPGH